LGPRGWRKGRSPFRPTERRSEANVPFGDASQSDYVNDWADKPSRSHTADLSRILSNGVSHDQRVSLYDTMFQGLRSKPVSNIQRDTHMKKRNSHFLRLNEAIYCMTLSNIHSTCRFWIGLSQKLY